MINSYDILRHSDHRGSFFEVPNRTEAEIAQYSVSISNKGVLRGLHYQYQPPMGKQINIIKGSILDCVVDLRLSSPTYGKHKLILCTPEKNSSIYVPPGFAHGFLSLEDDTTILYLQTSLYNKKGEGGICPFDDHLKIDWGITREECVLSEKDSEAESFLEFTAKNFNWSIL